MAAEGTSSPLPREPPENGPEGPTRTGPPGSRRRDGRSPVGAQASLVSRSVRSRCPAYQTPPTTSTASSTRPTGPTADVAPQPGGVRPDDPLGRHEGPLLDAQGLRPRHELASGSRATPGRQRPRAQWRRARGAWVVAQRRRDHLGQLPEGKPRRTGLSPGSTGVGAAEAPVVPHRGPRLLSPAPSEEDVVNDGARADWGQWPASGVRHRGCPTKILSSTVETAGGGWYGVTWLDRAPSDLGVWAGAGVRLQRGLGDPAFVPGHPGPLFGRGLTPAITATEAAHAAEPASFALCVAFVASVSSDG